MQAWELLLLVFVLGPLFGFLGAKKLKRSLVAAYVGFCVCKAPFAAGFWSRAPEQKFILQPVETWLFSTKIKGNHHLQGNVQVYNGRIPPPWFRCFDFI